MVSTQDFNDLKVSVSRLREDLDKLTTVFNAEQLKFLDGLQVICADQENKLHGVVGDARAEFGRLNAAGADLYAKTESSVNDLYTKVNELQRGGGGSGKRDAGYIPQKMAVPKPFSDKLEDWRAWQEEIEDYMDSINSGVKKLLQDVNGTASEIDETWKLDRMQMYDPKVLGDEVNIYRALKILTIGEAKKVVTNVKDENGFLAWQRLRQRFEPTLTAKQGLVLAEFSGMIAKPAKTPADLVGLMTEMDKKVKLIEDLTNEVVSDMHKKSVLIGILDQLTRQHTAMHHGGGYEQMRKVVAEFACNAMVTATHGDAMQVGAVTENGGKEYEKKEDEWAWETEQSALALGQAMKCYNCGGFGHLSRNCSSPKKNKGDGKGNEKGGGVTEKGQQKGGYGKAGGKGKGVGANFTGCWTCGGMHRQAECPRNGGKGGKGGGKGGIRYIEENSTNWYAQSQEENIGRLSCIKECCRKMEPKIDKTFQMPKIDHTDIDIHTETIYMKNHDEKRKSVSDKIRDETMKQGTRMEASNLLDEPLSPAMTHQPCSCRVPNFTGDSVADKDVEDMITEKGWTVFMSKKARKYANLKEKKQHAKEKLNLFFAIEPEGLNPVTQDNAWQEIELAVDSGATETVMGEEMLDFIDIKEGLASKRGVEYEVANGHKIPNLGEKKFVGTSDEGMTRHITAQVCDVNKALLSVKRMMAAGNRVVFDSEGSYIEDKATKEKMWMREDKGLFMLKLWVRKGF